MESNLKSASIGIRKAAALRSVKNGEFEPFFDAKEPPDNIIAIVRSRDGREIRLTSGDVTYAEHLTWNEIYS